MFNIFKKKPKINKVKISETEYENLLENTKKLKECQEKSSLEVLSQLIENSQRQEIILEQQENDLENIKVITNIYFKKANEILRTAEFSLISSEKLNNRIEDIKVMFQKLEININNFNQLVGKFTDLNENLISRNKTILELVENIFDISEQTNMLALNSTIESFRAGKDGQGFGVLSGEIRALADKSNSSARKIKEEINTLLNLGDLISGDSKQIKEMVFDSTKLSVRTIEELKKTENEVSINLANSTVTLEGVKNQLKKTTDIKERVNSLIENSKSNVTNCEKNKELREELRSLLIKKFQ
jgi:methyl-accepting chemotaxis protein